MDESTLVLDELGASDESLARLNHELHGAKAELARHPRRPVRRRGGGRPSRAPVGTTPGRRADLDR